MNIRVGTKVYSSVYLYVLLVIYGSILQMPLGLSYLDEIVFFMNIGIYVKYVLFSKKFRSINFLIVIFTLSGLIGNIMWHYQPAYLALIDCLNNLRFIVNVLAISTYLYSIDSHNRLKKLLRKHCTYVIYILYAELAVSFINQYIVHFTYWTINRLAYNEPSLTGIIGCLMVLILITSEKDNLSGRDIKELISLSILMLLIFKVKSMLFLFVFWYIYFFSVKKRKPIGLSNYISALPMVLLIAMDRIQVFYSDMSGNRERTVLTRFSFKIMQDYFPFGTGFGTYASYSAAKNYSQVYRNYGINKIYNMGEDSKVQTLVDTFWPMIIGQGGLIGLISFLCIVLFVYFRLIKPLKKFDIFSYAGALVIMVYLLLDSFAEASFTNWSGFILSIVLGVCIGCCNCNGSRKMRNNYSFEN